MNRNVKDLSMPLPPSLIFKVALAAVLLASAPLASAQVYKWVDDKGVVNYGSKPPAAARGAKPATVVEDRVSVYTPDPAVVQATQNARDRSGLPNPGGSFTPQGQAERRAPPAMAAPAPAPSTSACANGDVDCYGYGYGYPGYDGPAYGRYRAPHLVQPHLPPGAIAGNVNAGSGYIPGQSTQPPPVGTPPATNRSPGASFTLKERDDQRSDRSDRGNRGR
jgi:hypothetical protein